MIKHPEQRVGVFVDVQNMYHSARNLYNNARVNFKELLKTAVAGRKLVMATAYVIKSESREETAFFEALDSQGFKVRMKDLQTFSSGAKKADWDVGLAVDIVRMAPKLDVVVLVSGDGDFAPLVEYLQNHGMQVEIVAFGKTTSHLIVDQADDVIDLSENPKKYLIKKY